MVINHLKIPFLMKTILLILEKFLFFFYGVLYNKGRIHDVSSDRKLYQLDLTDICVQNFFYNSTKPSVNMYLIFHRDLQGNSLQ